MRRGTKYRPVCQRQSPPRRAPRPPTRHPELVSGSIASQAPTVRAAAWMLKQVQHDGAARRVWGFERRTPTPGPDTRPGAGKLRTGSPPRGRLHLGGLARTILRPPPFDPGLRRGRQAQDRLPVGVTPLRLSLPLRSLRETDFRRGDWGESPPPPAVVPLPQGGGSRLPTEAPACAGVHLRRGTKYRPVCQRQPPPRRNPALPLVTLNLFQGPLRRKRRLRGPQHGC